MKIDYFDQDLHTQNDFNKYKLTIYDGIIVKLAAGQLIMNPIFTDYSRLFL